MYSVYLDGQYLLYSTNISSLEIYDTKLTLETGKAGLFEFTVAPNHPEYGFFNELLSVITIYHDSEMVFRGRVFDTEIDVNRNKRVYCEGDLAYLHDSMIAPHTFSGTKQAYLDYIISYHNLNLSSQQTFLSGILSQDGSTDTISVVETEYKSAWDLIISQFPGTYMSIYYSDDGMILYLIDNSIHDYSGQDIRFGDNLVDINVSSENDDFFTAIIPLGAKIEGTEERLTIKSVTGNVDFIVNTTLANKYGRIFRTVIFDNITAASTLYSKGQAYINNFEKPYSSEIIAVDKSLIDGSGNALKINNIVQVYSDYHFSDSPQSFLINKIEIDITDPAKNRVYAGLLRKGITDIASGSSSTTVINQEAEQPYLIDSGESGIWTWANYSDGTAECFGKLNVQAVSTGSSIGSWYRTAEMYGSKDYPYPITFSEAPSTTIQFHTRNGNGALVWTFSVDAENQKQYLPQCYLIRPTQSSNIYGNINIIVKGKYNANS